MLTHSIIILTQAIAAYLIGSFILDIAHYLLHKFAESPHKRLKKIGAIHTAHHRFYTSALTFQDEYAKQNILQHVLFEYLVQLASIVACIIFFDPLAIVFAALFQTGIFIGVCCCNGKDAHHKTYETLPAYRGGIFVTAEYHALHHRHPKKFFSSNIKLLDYILGTGIYLKDKQIAMTGASGALGRHMKKLLEKEGAIVTCFKFGVDYHYDHYEKLKEPLAKADILFLCHGSKYEDAQQANCNSYVDIITLFKQVKKKSIDPLEVWGVGSEIECHPCFGIKKIKVYAKSKRSYAKHARNYFRDTDILYRHLVHSSFISPMGPGLMTASFAAKVTMFFIKRGFKYVPVSYTGFAFINYLRFVFNK